MIKKTGSLNPHVDVSGQESPATVLKKEAQHYALPSIKKYPLDRYDHVAQAVDYFEKNAKLFTPQSRREYCHNLVKRASVLGINTTPMIRKYGSDTFAPEEELEIALESRKTVLAAADRDTEIDILDKLAALRPQMSPDGFAVALGEFDKSAGIAWMYDEHIIDPYYSTYGEKTSEVKDPEASLVVDGIRIVTAKELNELGMTQFKGLADTFGDEMAKEFQKDPIGIFKSLPLDQKRLVIGLATDDAPK